MAVLRYQFHCSKTNCWFLVLGEFVPFLNKPRHFYLHSSYIVFNLTEAADRSDEKVSVSNVFKFDSQSDFRPKSRFDEMILIKKI